MIELLGFFGLFVIIVFISLSHPILMTLLVVISVLILVIAINVIMSFV